MCLLWKLWAWDGRQLMRRTVSSWFGPRQWSGVLQHVEARSSVTSGSPSSCSCGGFVRFCWDGRRGKPPLFMSPPLGVFVSGNEGRCRLFLTSQWGDTSGRGGFFLGGPPLPPVKASPNMLVFGVGGGGVEGVDHSYSVSPGGWWESVAGGCFCFQGGPPLWWNPRTESFRSLWEPENFSTAWAERWNLKKFMMSPSLIHSEQRRVVLPRSHLDTLCSTWNIELLEDGQSVGMNGWMVHSLMLHQWLKNRIIWTGEGSTK